MFDLITGREKHLPSHPTAPILLSTFAQAMLIAVIALIPMLFVSERLPEVPTMMAFVAAPPAPPPPPPPPVAAKPKPMPPKADATRAKNQFVAPLEEPAQIQALPDDEGVEFGMPGGVEGGIPGGVVGGLVGGLPEAPPPPPPPPAAPKAPVRVGGQITQPRLVKRVEPEYPALAVNAHIQGVVILEATVGEDGDVMEVRLLRSANPLLDREAEKAVRQWRYSPVVLNGIPVPFILTVTLSFFLEAPK
jgi:periplasmic protein TonB